MRDDVSPFPATDNSGNLLPYLVYLRLFMGVIPLAGQRHLINQGRFQVGNAKGLANVMSMLCMLKSRSSETHKSRKMRFLLAIIRDDHDKFYAPNCDFF